MCLHHAGRAGCQDVLTAIILACAHYPCMRTLSLHAHIILACAHYPCMRRAGRHPPRISTAPPCCPSLPSMDPSPLPPVDGSIARPHARPPVNSRCLSRGASLAGARPPRQVGALLWRPAGPGACCAVGTDSESSCVLPCPAGRRRTFGRR